MASSNEAEICNTSPSSITEADDKKSAQDENSEVVEGNGALLENLQLLAQDSLECLQESMLTSSASKENVEKYIPGPLAKEGKSLDDIKQCLLGIIARGEAEEAEELAISYVRPPNLVNDEVHKIALLSHTMAAYISTLNENLVLRIGMQMVSDTSLWISKTFRYFDSSAYFNKENRAGLVSIIRMLLHCKYPKYINQGYEALYTRPPIIYYCDAMTPGLGQYLCTQLGLPTTCLSPVPCLAEENDNEFKMDTSALEKCIIGDASSSKVPLLVIANAGIPLTGQVDDLTKIQEICLSQNVWLHIDGHNLAALSLVKVPNLPSNVGDSMSLSLGKWIGLPSLPYITLYKAKEMAHVHAAGLIQASHGHLDFLPVWVTIQALGHSGLTHRIQYSFELCDILLDIAESFPELRIISKRKFISKEGKKYEAATIGENSISTMVLFEALSSVIVFQYVPQVAEGEEEERKNPPYFDNLNSWLVQILARQVPGIRTEILDLEEFGVCLRVCPVESTHIVGTTKEDTDLFCQSLQQQVSILNSTVLQRKRLYENHKNHPKLKVVELANWAGMGGVRFVPDFWADRLNELTDTGKEDINRLNSELVAKLRASDSAFSTGEADDGMLCVRFGMVDDKLDMTELINLVTSAGQELEESSKFLETMSEMIKHGIEEANKELVQENQEKIMQEGILRQVPVLGSLVSWWYPAPKETGVKGRSFNLSSGTIESTENIYRYHMQIKEGSKSPTPSTKVRISPSPSQISPTEENCNNTTQNHKLVLNEK